jgi:hypothetical protein
MNRFFAVFGLAVLASISSQAQAPPDAIRRAFGPAIVKPVAPDSARTLTAAQPARPDFQKPDGARSPAADASSIEDLKALLKTQTLLITALTEHVQALRSSVNELKAAQEATDSDLKSALKEIQDLRAKLPRQ